MAPLDPLPGRPLPADDDGDAFFWSAGADGRLHMQRCGSCELVVHPPAPRCPRCLSADVAPQPLRGTGRVATFTVNHQPWTAMAVPYVVAIVELDDQEALQLTTNIRGCAPDDVEIGMPVRVVFERHERPDTGSVYVPVFIPSTGEEGRDGNNR